VARSSSAGHRTRPPARIAALSGCIPRASGLGLEGAAARFVRKHAKQARRLVPSGDTQRAGPLDLLAVTQRAALSLTKGDSTDALGQKGLLDLLSRSHADDGVESLVVASSHLLPQEVFGVTTEARKVVRPVCITHQDV
jgi:hypothetical protein